MLLEGLKLPYDLHQLEFSDARQPEYLRLNPSGLLPTIRIQNTDITLLEVSMSTLPLSCCLAPPGEPNRHSKTAIIVYLIDQYDKEDKLFYRDEPGKYLTQQWLAFQISGKDQTC